MRRPDMDDRVAELEIGVGRMLEEIGLKPLRSGYLPYNGAYAHALERFVANAGAKRQGGCRGIGGWLFGHRLERRESVTGVETVKHGRLGYFDEDYPLTTYHGDVCTRCGLVVNVPAATPEGGRDDGR